MPFSKERIAQACGIIQRIREAYGRSSVLPDKIRHICPKTIVPGSLDHLRFLVEFVEDNKSIVRTASAYSMSHGSVQGYSTERVTRLSETGISKPIDMIKKSLSQFTLHKILGCKLCHKLMLTCVKNKANFLHDCKERVKEIKADDPQPEASSSTSAPPSEEPSTVAVPSTSTTDITLVANTTLPTFEEDKSLAVKDDQTIHTYLKSLPADGNAPKRVVGSDAYKNDKRVGMKDPSIFIHLDQPLPYVIARDFDPTGTCSSAAMRKAGLSRAYIETLLSDHDKAAFIEHLGLERLQDLDHFGMPIWMDEQEDKAAAVQKQVDAILDEFALSLIETPVLAAQVRSLRASIRIREEVFDQFYE